MSVAKTCTRGTTCWFARCSLTSDGDGVHLLARRAARHPDADRIVRAFSFEQPGNDGVGQALESFRIAEEVGDVDQQVAEQESDFLRRHPQHLHVARRVGRLRDLHAALHAPDECALLVAAEVVADLIAQDRVDLRQHRPHFAIAGQFLRRIQQPLDDGQAAGEFGKARAHLGDGNGQVHESRRDGGVGHVGMARAELAADLRQGQPAAFLDRLQPEGAIAVPAGEHDTGRAFTQVRGE